MSTAPATLPPPPAPMSANDIFYIIFRHKWKIVICTVLGWVAAGVYYFSNPPPFQSEAMLFIRYVTESSAPGLPGAGEPSSISPAGYGGGTILNTEVDIISSLDIANQAADTVGPDKILSKVKNAKLRDRDHAAAAIRGGLRIDALPGSSVIHLVFSSSDPTIVQPVMNAIVDAYYKKHVEVHKQAAAIGDFLSQETDQLRTRLQQTEDELRKVKDKAGIISLEDSKKSAAEQEMRLQADIFSAQAELAERSARYDQLAKSMPPVPKAVAAEPGQPEPPPVPSAQIDAYHSVLARLDRLQRSEQQLLTQFTDQNQQVKDVHSQISEAETQRQALEEKYPGLTRFGLPIAPSPGGTATASPASPASTVDLRAEAAYLSGVQSKIKMLNDELDAVRKGAAMVDGLEGNISELQRQKDLEEANYRYYYEHLEASHIDETLGSNRAPNIAEIQAPTPPFSDYKAFYKKVGEVSAGGLVLGLAWAFLIEFYLDRSIRRPQDIVRGLQIPLFLSIPDFGKNGRNRHKFHETLRDRLIGFFEHKGFKHKPKLVAVTGVRSGAGVTAIACGLARSLSQTGDTNVLLVDMTKTQGSAQQFSQGKALCNFDELLDTRANAQVQENLYVVCADANSEQLARALPSRFNSLVPQLKASNFDYIIFDMPTVNQISITPRLAQFMDMVLLVVESERTDRDLAKQATALFADSHVPIGAVLNKTRNYVPSKAHHEFLGTA